MTNCEIEAQREILNQIIKKVIKRIKELQKQLENVQKDCNFFGHYVDCGSYYKSQVARTEAIISELINQKISFQKWRKKLKYDLLTI